MIIRSAVMSGLKVRTLMKSDGHASGSGENTGKIFCRNQRIWRMGDPHQTRVDGCVQRNRHNLRNQKKRKNMMVRTCVKNVRKKELWRKRLKIFQKEKGPLEGQERDGWNCWIWYEENGCLETGEKQLGIESPRNWSWRCPGTCMDRRTGGGKEELEELRVTWRTFGSEDPQILGATEQNRIPRGTWHPGLEHLCTKVFGLRPDCIKRLPQYHKLT